MRSNRLLQTIATTLLLAASAAASIAPDWATVLKAQGYYGSVDLRLSVQPAGGVRAGADTDLLVTIANGGPDDAHGTRTHALVRGDATVGATNGCNEDPLGFPACTLAAPLPAGGSADYLLRVSVPPLARGYVTVALSAQSWDVETAPGQETALLELPIEAHVDLRVSAQCDHRWLKPDMPLSCQIVLFNAGPAAAYSPQFVVDVAGSAVSDFSCNATRADLCPGAVPAQWQAALMAPTDTAVLWFQLNAAPLAETLSLQASALAAEIEDHSADNGVALSVDVPLFRDDFEGAPPREP